MPAGKLFESFDESWQSFLERREPLESFLEEVPADVPDGNRAVAWLLCSEAKTRKRAVAAQDSLPRLPWLRRLDASFLHVFVGPVALEGDTDVAAELARGSAVLADLAPFELRVPRLTCFHAAIVAEVEPRERVADLHERLFPGRGTASLLPHMTLAVFTERADPSLLRDALVPLRSTDLGTFVVREIALCLIPWTRTTVLEPWEVAGTAPLTGTKEVVPVRRLP